MTFFDVLFSEWRWYREWRGGTWRRIGPRYHPDLSCWTRGHPLNNERTYITETYD